jgi:hypothetical protein
MHIDQRVIKTLELFSIQSIAPSLLEVWRFLVKLDEDELEFSVGDVAKTLCALVQEGLVAERFGLYALRDSVVHIEQRWLGYQYGLLRERRVRRLVGGLRYVPFVRGVALAGSQALGLERASSDIDLLIITAPGWLWLPRTLVTAYFHFLGVRRYGKKIANRVCLNHYISGPKCMQDGHNWYTAFEYGKLRPIFGRVAISDFQTANATWIHVFFPNVQSVCATKESVHRIQLWVEILVSHTVGSWLESRLGSWQSKRIHKNEPHITVADDELSFHPASKQDAVLASFRY